MLVWTDKDGNQRTRKFSPWVEESWREWREFLESDEGREFMEATAPDTATPDTPRLG